MHVAIVGAGSVGLTLALQLTRQGHRVDAVVEADPVRRTRLRDAGILRMSGRLGEARLPMPHIVADPAEIAGAEVVFVAVTAAEFDAVAASVPAAVHGPQTFVLMTAYVSGVDRFSRSLPDRAGEREVFGLGSSPYLCFAQDSGAVQVAAVKSWVETIGESDAAAERGAERLARFFPQTVPARQQLAAALNNSNPVAHIPSWLCHAGTAAGRRAQGCFHLPDFDTPEVQRLRLRIDAERVEVMVKLGIEGYALTRAEFALRSYGPGDRIAALPRVGPTFQRRFVTEDVPFGLAPLEFLAIKLGLRVPAISAALDAVEQREARDYRGQGARAGELAWERALLQLEGRARV